MALTEVKFFQSQATLAIPPLKYAAETQRQAAQTHTARQRSPFLPLINACSSATFWQVLRSAVSVSQVELVATSKLIGCSNI